LDASSAGALTLGGSVATSIAASSLKITGLANGTTSTDAAAFGQIGTAVNAAVSGTTNTLAKFTGTNVVGDSGATDDGTTFGTTRVLQVTKAGIGTTATIGLDLYNSTNSGTQYSPMERWSAWNGGTQVNFGVRWEPQSTSRGKLVFYTGTGSGAPSGGGGGTYWDPQDPTFGEGWISNGFYSGTTSAGGAGFRFRHSSNNGGLKYRSSDDSIYLTSYNSKNVAIETGADSGGSGGTERLVITSTGATTWTHATSAVTRKQHGTAGVNYVDRTGLASTVTASGTATLYTIATVSNSYVDVEIRGFAYLVGTVGNVQAFGYRCAFKNIAGTVTDGTPENIRAPDNLGTAWGTPPSVTFSHSGTNILITGAAAGATDTRFNITEIKWFVSTTSA
jgi:hypothetical protein